MSAPTWRPSTRDLIAEAAHLLAAPVDLQGWTPPEVETHDELAQAEADETEARRVQAVDAWLEAGDIKLLGMRYVREAAQQRTELYVRERDRWARLARREERITEHVEALARVLLEAERTIAGYSDNEPYVVGFDDGTKIGLRLNPPSVVISGEISELPSDCQRVTIAPDRATISRRLKAGETIPGCALTRSLSIRWGA